MREFDPQPYDGVALPIHIYPAKEDDVSFLLEMPVHDDGRSDFEWMRFPNGDLALVCWPHGATYEVLTQLRGVTT